MFQPQRLPLLKPRRPKLVIETQRRLIPIESGPFDAGAVPRDCDPRDVTEQGTTYAPAALCGLDEQILDPEPGPALEG